jgi:hypothetical protein
VATQAGQAAALLCWQHQQQQQQAAMRTWQHCWQGLLQQLQQVTAMQELLLLAGSTTTCQVISIESSMQRSHTAAVSGCAALAVRSSQSGLDCDGRLDFSFNNNSVHLVSAGTTCSSAAALYVCCQLCIEAAGTR